MLGAVELVPSRCRSLEAPSWIAWIGDECWWARRRARSSWPGGVAAAAFLGSPAVAVLYPAAVLAGFNALQNIAQSAIVLNLVEPARLPQTMAVNYGLYALTLVLGPGVGVS